MGGNLGESGSVAWMFEHKGVIRFPANGLSEDDVLEKMIDYDIDDVSIIDNIVSVSCEIKELDSVKKGAAEVGVKIEDVSIEWVPKNPVRISEKSQEEQVLKFLESLEELDDVQNVYANIA